MAPLWVPTQSGGMAAALHSGIAFAPPCVMVTNSLAPYCGQVGANYL